jgi:Ni/Co efflux regulator RcnB
MEPFMDHKTVISAILAITLASPGFSLAQGPGARNDRDRDEQAQRDGPQDRRGDDSRSSDRRQPSWQARQDQRRADRDAQRREDRRDDRRADRYGGGRSDLRAGGRNDRGAGPQRAWHQGDRVPPQYRGYTYVVDDWRGHRLSAPPSGYHWVQSGSDYVLVAIATGIILSILLSN